MWGVRHFIVFIQLAAEDVNCAAGENSWKERPSMSLSIRSQKSRFKIWQFTIGCIVGIAVIFEYVHVSSWYKIRVLLEEHLFVLVWQRDEISAFLDPTLSYNAAGQLVSVQEGVKAASIFLPRHLAEHHVSEVSWIFQIWCRLWTMKSLLQLAVESGETSPWCSNFQDLQAWNNAYMECCPGERCVMAFSTQSLRTLQAFLLSA